MKAFTNASSLQSKLRTLGNHVDDDATVDAPGVIIHSCGDLVSTNCAFLGTMTLFI